MPLFAEKNIGGHILLAKRKAEFTLRFVTLVLAFVSATLCAMIWSIQRAGLGARSTPSGENPFFYLIVAYEPQMLALVTAGFVALYVVIRRPETFSFLTSRWNRFGPITGRKLVLLGLLLMALTALGRYFFYLDYDCCADESLSRFQSKIFIEGHVLGPIPQQWQPFSNTAAIPLLTVHPQQENWCSEFLPIHSLLRVPATLIGLDGYMCAVYLGLNLILLYYLLRRIWPHHPTRAAVGLILFAVFPHVLVTSMTSYSMETHALFTVIWLLLYTSEAPLLFLLTPWFGVLSMGIHQPHIHTIFAAPFVLRLALQRRFFEFAYFCLVYLGGLLFWVGYLHMIRTSSVADGLFNKFGFNPMLQMLVQPGNVALLLGWSPLALCLLFPVACLTLRRKDGFLFCCAAACFLLAAFHFVWPTQGHGWGERFLYPAVPFAIIVGLHGLPVLRRAMGRRGAMNLILFSALIALVVGLPYRLHEIHQFESTNRAVHVAITRTDSDVVLLDVERIWFGVDQVQNNPAMDNRPAVLSLERLSPDQLKRLREEKLSLKILGIDDFRATGHPEEYVREQD